VEYAGPLYALADVREAVAKGKVTFSYQAEADYQELGLSKEEALACIDALLPSEYRKSLSYEGLQPFDDYVTGPQKVPAEPRPVRIYIKFRIPSPSCVMQVYVTSFHICRDFYV
jgi:hypothetical protein